MEWYTLAANVCKKEKVLYWVYVSIPQVLLMCRSHFGLRWLHYYSLSCFKQKDTIKMSLLVIIVMIFYFYYDGAYKQCYKYFVDVSEVEKKFNLQTELQIVIYYNNESMSYFLQMLVPGWNLTLQNFTWQHPYKWVKVLFRN